MYAILGRTLPLNSTHIYFSPAGESWIEVDESLSEQVLRVDEDEEDENGSISSDLSSANSSAGASASGGVNGGGYRYARAAVFSPGIFSGGFVVRSTPIL